MSQPTSPLTVARLLLTSMLKRSTEPTPSRSLPTQHPLPTDRDGWKAHWLAQGQPWRTEPEIDIERQKYLAERREIMPDIEQGIYPFRDVKLNRADIEWLLVTHENGRGPVDWSDESQSERKGLDLRGVDLRTVNLSFLPLAHLHAGLTPEERPMQENRVMHSRAAAAHLEDTNLYKAHLEEAILCWTHLEDASLEFAHLELANLEDAHLEGASLRRAHLEGTSLRFAFFDIASNLNYASLSNKKLGSVFVGDTNWNSINLAMIDWSQIDMLGDERKARQKIPGKKMKKDSTRWFEYRIAVRANRQLAVALQAQGLNEDAARFAYRAQVLQRKVLWNERKFWKWFGSATLAVLAGYGYRMWRIIAAYLIIVSACAVAYFILGIYFSPHISPSQAFLESIMAFHGRVFFELFNPGEPQIWITAFEAVAGLIVEGVFIAMLAQRFFGK